MQWLQENGLWILFVLAIFGMHMFGHGGHGHGNHGGRHDHGGRADPRGTSTGREPAHHGQPTPREPGPWREG